MQKQLKPLKKQLNMHHNSANHWKNDVLDFRAFRPHPINGNDGELIDALMSNCWDIVAKGVLPVVRAPGAVGKLCAVVRPSLIHDFIRHTKQGPSDSIEIQKMQKNLWTNMFFKVML